MQTIGTNIKYFRGKENMSQDIFAEKLNFSKHTISAFENNKRLPNVADFIRICDILGASADTLLGLPTENKYPDLKKGRLSTRIANIREHAGETENEFAKKLNISVSTLKKYEHSHRIPPLQRIKDICEGYGYSADYLLGRDRGGV